MKPSAILAQNDIVRSNIAIEKGIYMYNQKEYIKAEKYLKKSIILQPQMKAYYQLAYTQFQLKDTCEGCKNLYYAYYDGDKVIKAEYDSICFKRVRVNFQNEPGAESIYYSYFLKDKSSGEIHQDFYLKNYKTGELFVFHLPAYDSVETVDPQFFIKHPDLKDITSEQIVYTNISQMPEYPEGEAYLYQMLGAKLEINHPVKRVIKIQGTAYVRFIVEKDGSLTDISVVKGLVNLPDESLIKAFKSLHRWAPGKIGTAPVRVQITVPVRISYSYKYVIEFNHS